ncbi:MAG: hypothetical protein J2P21_25345 [Chloracidobacterium sp.]|nr:hypothetical protein [Chloracidobacterium sp.]
MKFTDISRAIFIALLLLPHSAFAQGQNQPAEAPPIKKSKAGAATCDGAVDIVPGKPATFTRKRRPSKTSAKSEEKQAETKPKA